MEDSPKNKPKTNNKIRNKSKLKLVLNRKEKKEFLSLKYISPMNSSHIDSSHIDSSHIDNSHIDNSVIDNSHIDNSVIDNSHIDNSHINRHQMNKLTLQLNEKEKKEYYCLRNKKKTENLSVDPFEQNIQFNTFNQNELIENNEKSKEKELKIRRQKNYKPTEGERALLMLAHMEMNSGLFVNEVHNNDMAEEEKVDGEKQIADTIGHVNNCKFYTNFTFEELKEILTYCLGTCKMNKSTNWIDVVHKNSIIRTKNENKVSDLFLLFYFFFFKFYPSFYDAFKLMKLNRFLQKNDYISDNISTAKSVAKRLYSQAINFFSLRLYDNVVRVRASIPLEDKANFASGRVEAYRGIIWNLEKVLYLIDGKNQDCSTKFVTGTHTKNKEYYNFKHKTSGYKYLVRVDPSGYACWQSKAFPAAISDATIQKITFDETLIPNGYYKMADSGFSGCDKCICPFKNSTIKSKQLEQCFVSVDKYHCILEIKHGYGGKDVTNIPLTVLCTGSADNGNNFNGCLYGMIDDTDDDNEKDCVVNDKSIEFLIKGAIEKRDKCFILRDVDVKNSLNCTIKNHSKVLKNSYMKLKQSIDNSTSIVVEMMEIKSDKLKVFNVTHSSIRILVENFFGRKCVLFEIAHSTYTHDAGDYELVNMMTTALTNCHLWFHPLRKFNFYDHFINGNNKQIEDDQYELTQKIMHIIEKYYGNDNQMNLNENNMTKLTGTPVQLNYDIDQRMDDQIIDVERMDEEKNETLYIDLDTDSVDVEWMSIEFIEFCSQHIFPKFYCEFFSISCLVFLHGINQNRIDDENAKRFHTTIELLLSEDIVMIPLCFNSHYVLLSKVGDDCYFIDSFNKEISMYPQMKDAYDIINKINWKRRNKQISLSQIIVEKQTDGCTCGYRVIMYMLLIYSIKPFNPNTLKNVRFKKEMFKKLEYVVKSFESFKDKVLIPSELTQSIGEDEKIKEFSNKHYFKILEVLNEIIVSLK